MIRFIAALCIGLATCAAARAQAMFEGPYLDPFAPAATVREAERLADDAGLSQDGKTAATALVRGTNSVLERLRARYQRKWERASLEPVPAGKTQMGLYYEQVQERLREHRAVCASLLSDLHALVPQDREDAWQSFDRRRRRRVCLNATTRDGIAMDLVQIAETLKVDADPAVRAALAGYEVELDSLLRQRLAAFPSSLRDLTEPKEGAEEDENQKAFGPVRDIDCAILRVQRAGAERLEKALPENRRAELRSLVMRARGAAWAHTRTRQRAGKLLSDGQLAPPERAVLAAAVERYDRGVHEGSDAALAKMEDRECAATYEEAQKGFWDAPERRECAERTAKLDLQLWEAVSRVATEDMLDAIDLELEKAGQASPE
jgi:hypothetical protein